MLNNAPNAAQILFCSCVLFCFVFHLGKAENQTVASSWVAPHGMRPMRPETSGKQKQARPRGRGRRQALL